MQKAQQFILLLAIQIVILFAIGIGMTYLNDAIQSSGFFGDVLLKEPLKFCFLDEYHEWGARHFWYWWMCLILFLLGIARIVLWSVNFWKRHD